MTIPSTAKPASSTRQYPEMKSSKIEKSKNGSPSSQSFNRNDKRNSQSFKRNDKRNLHSQMTSENFDDQGFFSPQNVAGNISSGALHSGKRDEVTEQGPILQNFFVVSDDSFKLPGLFWPFKR